MGEDVPRPSADAARVRLVARAGTRGAAIVGSRPRCSRASRSRPAVAWFRAGIARRRPRRRAPARRRDTGRRRPHDRDRDHDDGRAPRSSSTSSARCAARASSACRAGARVVDAIAAAGGATPDADLTRLNLAAPLADGSRVAVPRVGAPAPAVDPAAVSGSRRPRERRRPAGGRRAGQRQHRDRRAARGAPGHRSRDRGRDRQRARAHGPFRQSTTSAASAASATASSTQLRDLVTV